MAVGLDHSVKGKGDNNSVLSLDNTLLYSISHFPVRSSSLTTRADDPSEPEVQTLDISQNMIGAGKISLAKKLYLTEINFGHLCSLVHNEQI